MSEKNIETTETQPTTGVVEATKAVKEPVERITPPDSRQYFIPEGTQMPVIKSKQRAIVVAALAKNTEPSTAKELEPFCGDLKAKAGTLPSILYHLHYLAKSGLAAVANPTFLG